MYLSKLVNLRSLISFPSHRSTGCFDNIALVALLSPLVLKLQTDIMLLFVEQSITSSRHSFTYIKLTYI